MTEPGPRTSDGEAGRAGGAGGVRKRRPVLLAAFVLGPLAVIAGLMWAIAWSLAHDPGLKDEPKGAGAGQTGGANAIGEWLSDR